MTNMTQKKIITASQIGAMLGKSSYKTRRQLWLELAGLRNPEPVAGPHIDAGLAFEAPIMELTAINYDVGIIRNTDDNYFRLPTPGLDFEGFNKQTRVVNRSMRIGATPDGWIDYPNNIFENGGREFFSDGILRRNLSLYGPGCIEVKTQWYKRRWETPPEQYQLQLLTQLLVTGLRWGAIVTMDGLNPVPRVFVYLAHNDENRRDMDMIQLEALRFMESVDAGVEPELDPRFPDEVFESTRMIIPDGEIDTDNDDFIAAAHRLSKITVDQACLTKERRELEARLLKFNMITKARLVRFRGVCGGWVAFGNNNRITVKIEELHNGTE